jgi:hypothetical protein
MRQQPDARSRAARSDAMSSYPYFVFAQADDMPDDYYSRLLAGRTLPAMVVEGGWTSAPAGAITSTPEKAGAVYRASCAVARQHGRARIGATRPCGSRPGDLPATGSR